MRIRHQRQPISPRLATDLHADAIGNYTPEQDGTVEINLLTADKDVSYTLFQYVFSGAPSS
jgi:hypothetical protein